MQMRARQIGSVMVLTLEGKLVGPEASAFLRRARRRLSAASPPLVAIDLGQVPEVDSGGFGALLSLLRDVESRRGGLALVGLHREVRILLEIMQLHLLFEVRNDVHEACEALESTGRSPGLVVTRAQREPLRADGPLLEGKVAS